MTDGFHNATELGRRAVNSATYRARHKDVINQRSRAAHARNHGTRAIPGETEACQADAQIAKLCSPSVRADPPIHRGEQPVSTDPRRRASGEPALLRVLACLGGETVQGDFQYGDLMAAIYDAIATFRDRHVAMFEHYEDGYNADAARHARLAAEDAYEVGDLHAELAAVFEGIPERPVHPKLRLTPAPIQRSQK